MFTGIVEEIGTVHRVVSGQTDRSLEIQAELVLEGTRIGGSIAIDGVSLTVATVTERDFSVSLIPHTGSQTILLQKKPGDRVNLENDIVGKYVARLLSPAAPEPATESRITMDLLREHGF